jgi:hypothetical protein
VRLAIAAGKVSRMLGARGGKPIYGALAGLPGLWSGQILRGSECDGFERAVPWGSMNFAARDCSRSSGLPVMDGKGKESSSWPSSSGTV